jgi:CubicO group peptidase (beta-lactamase class C family)
VPQRPNQAILRTAALLLGVATAACGNSSSPATPTYATAVQEAQDAAFEALRGGETTSVGIALVDRDGVIWAGSFGMADIPARIAVTDATMFGIGSVSKVVAAVAEARGLGWLLLYGSAGGDVGVAVGGAVPP